MPSTKSKYATATSSTRSSPTRGSLRHCKSLEKIPRYAAAKNESRDRRGAVREALLSMLSKEDSWLDMDFTNVGSQKPVSAPSQLTVNKKLGANGCEGMGFGGFHGHSNAAARNPSVWGDISLDFGDDSDSESSAHSNRSTLSVDRRKFKKSNRTKKNQMGASSSSALMATSKLESGGSNRSIKSEKSLKCSARPGRHRSVSPHPISRSPRSHDDHRKRSRKKETKRLVSLAAAGASANLPPSLLPSDTHTHGSVGNDGVTSSYAEKEVVDAFTRQPLQRNDNSAAGGGGSWGSLEIDMIDCEKRKLELEEERERTATTAADEALRTSKKMHPATRNLSRFRNGGSEQRVESTTGRVNHMIHDSAKL